MASIILSSVIWAPSLGTLNLQLIIERQEEMELGVIIYPSTFIFKGTLSI